MDDSTCFWYVVPHRTDYIDENGANLEAPTPESTTMPPGVIFDSPTNQPELVMPYVHICGNRPTDYEWFVSRNRPGYFHELGPTERIEHIRRRYNPGIRRRHLKIHVIFTNAIWLGITTASTYVIHGIGAAQHFLGEYSESATSVAKSETKPPTNTPGQEVTIENILRALIGRWPCSDWCALWSGGVCWSVFWPMCVVAGALQLIENQFNWRNQ